MASDSDYEKLLREQFPINIEVQKARDEEINAFLSGTHNIIEKITREKITDKAEDLLKMINETLSSFREKIYGEGSSISDRRIIVVADNDSVKILGIPRLTMSNAKMLFKFPPNHPISNTAYAMAEVYPDSYVPVAEFHDYFKQRKSQAFLKLCADLGAKEIYIESAEINNRSLDINADVKTPLNQLGLGFSLRQNRETGEISAYRFSEENKGIKEFDTPWLHTEPSWRSMYDLRRENHLQEIGVEFNYVNDFGINASLTTKFGPVGVNIGGSFSEMTKIKLSYRVIFW